MFDTLTCRPWCTRRHLTELDFRNRFYKHLGPVLPGVVRVLRSAGDGEVVARRKAREVQPVLLSSATESDETRLVVELGERGPGITLAVESWWEVPEVVALLELTAPR